MMWCCSCCSSMTLKRMNMADPSIGSLLKVLSPLIQTEGKAKTFAYRFIQEDSNWIHFHLFTVSSAQF